MNRKKGGARAIVPRSVLMYAGLGVGAGVIPICVAYSATGCEAEPPSVGISPAPSVGVVIEIEPTDAQPASDAEAMDDASTIGLGVYPALLDADPAPLDAEEDGSASDAASDAGEASTVDP